MKILAASLLAGVTLMACTPASEPAPETPAAPDATASAPVDPAAAPPVDVTNPPPDACGAAQYASLVGKPITEPGVPPEGPGVRYIRPNSQVTMDFRPDRLNIHIDANEIITEFRCT